MSATAGSTKYYTVVVSQLDGEGNVFRESTHHPRSDVELARLQERIAASNNMDHTRVAVHERQKQPCAECSKPTLHFCQICEETMCSECLTNHSHGLDGRWDNV